MDLALRRRNGTERNTLRAEHDRMSSATGEAQRNESFTGRTKENEQFYR